jgi:hypothetical protein
MSPTAIGTKHRGRSGSNRTETGTQPMKGCMIAKGGGREAETKGADFQSSRLSKQCSDHKCNGLLTQHSPNSDDPDPESEQVVEATAGTVQHGGSMSIHKKNWTESSRENTHPLEMGHGHANNQFDPRTTALSGDDTISHSTSVVNERPSYSAVRTSTKRCPPSEPNIEEGRSQTEQKRGRER